jgi:mannose-6-phosphate isomerase-like protein (cupin superfamily)
MKITKVNTELKKLRKISEEIHYKSCFEARRFSTGLIAFRPNKGSDPKQINHNDKDVVCHVLKGRGRLRINRRRIPLHPGHLCHIPKGTPHDFAAGKTGELVLLYSLINTG